MVEKKGRKIYTMLNIISVPRNKMKHDVEQLMFNYL